MVGVVPSGFTFAGVFLTGVTFVDVGFAVSVEAALVAFLTGAVLAVLFTVVAGLAAGVLVAGFFRTGSGLVVPRGVRVRAGFEASLMFALPVVTGVFFIGVAVDAGLLAEAVVTGFFAGVDVAAGVAVLFTEVEADAPPAFSFLGTLFTGVVVEPAASVVAATGFLTGVDLVVDAAVFAGVVVAGFFAVDSATLEMLPTLAVAVSLESLHSAY